MVEAELTVEVCKGEQVNPGVGGEIRAEHGGQVRPRKFARFDPPEQVWVEPEPFRERIAEELRAASAWYA